MPLGSEWLASKKLGLQIWRSVQEVEITGNRWVDKTQSGLGCHLCILGYRNASWRYYVKRPCRSVTAVASKVENVNDGCA
jgi:hypothetical protein